MTLRSLIAFRASGCISLLPRLSRTMSTTPRSSMSRPANWKAAAPVPGPPDGGITFGPQATLDRLPIPELPATLAKLKESLKPLAWNDAEYESAAAKIDAFAKEQGPILHQRLLKRAEDTDHWLEEWWDDAGYLGYRDSIVINVSYYYGFEPQPKHLGQAPSARAASLARAALLFRKRIKQATLKPDGTRDGVYCMDTYRWMFDCCRVPGPHGLDWGVSHALPEDSGDSGHIVVLRKNRIWKVDVSKDGRLLSTSELETQIRHIYENTLQEYPGVGVLASNHRDEWAKDYATLSSSNKNQAILDTIQSSAFVISLEETPSDSQFTHNGSRTPEALSRALWHGDISADGEPIGLRNRWVDKPIAFIVYDNSAAGLMGEHSVMDGTPPQRLCDDMLMALRSPSFDHGIVDPASSPVPNPVALDWEMVPGLAEAIDRAGAAAVKLIQSQALGFVQTNYGKAAIKNLRVSPDAWAQMIVQLAYRRLLARAGSQREGGTYEAATTRRFLKGRTEAIRVVSSESDAWVAGMNNPALGRSERLDLFNKACKVHISRARDAGNAQGIDRHLFGLKNVLGPNESMPDVFNDALVKRSSYWVLSTSAINSLHFDVYGWGEVVPNGFGVAYVTAFDDYLQFTITSMRDMPNASFCQEIEQAATDIYNLVAGTSKL